MKPVKTVFDKPWIPYKNRVDFFVDKKVNFDAPVTTVHGFCFNESNDLLMVKHIKRGWEIPGGHIDKGEKFEEAMRRELYEETQMYVDSLHVLGHLKKTALEEKPLNCVYPYPLSFCIFYAAYISKSEPFQGDESIVDFKFVELKESRKYSWIQSYDVYLNEAVKTLKT